MKIAFVHDWLVYPWGAEKVFFDMVEEIVNSKETYYFNKPFRESLNLINCTKFKIFTTFYNPSFKLPESYKVESVISTPKLLKYYRHLLPLFPSFQKLLSNKIQKYNPDLVIISSFAIAKNIDIKKPKILYLHSPMQYVWSHFDEYIKKFKFPTKQVFKLVAKYLRTWDKKYTEFDYIIFNSSYTKELFQEIYNKKVKGEIIHPKVKIPEFKEIDIFEKYKLQPWTYYIYIWRLVKLVKHLDKIIQAFNKNWKTLVIVWDWPDKEYLQNLAKENIKFLWYIPETSDNYRNLLKNAKALVNITKESFGIVNKQASLLNIPIVCKKHWAIQDISGKKVFIKNTTDLNTLE